MILHLDDRLLHGKILHGWSASSARRIGLISERMADPQQRTSCAEAAAPAPCLYIEPKARPLPPWAEGDFCLTDSLQLAAVLLREGAFAGLKIIGLREGGEDLGPDFSPGVASRKLLDEMALEGLRIEIQPFPGTRAWTWPP